jgi:hypothetical protein
MSIRQHAGQDVEVVDLDAWRRRRDELAAWNAALDWLDQAGLCACWVLPREHHDVLAATGTGR